MIDADALRPDPRTVGLAALGFVLGGAVAAAVRGGVSGFGWPLPLVTRSGAVCPQVIGSDCRLGYDLDVWAAVLDVAVWYAVGAIGSVGVEAHGGEA